MRDRGPRSATSARIIAIAAASFADVASGRRSSTPCAAAISSIATIRAVFAAIGISRRAAKVAMLT